MRLATARALGLVAIAGIALGGCDETLIHWVDPPVKLASAGSDADEGPPELMIGFSGEGGFATLEAAPALVVIHGLQGGTWTMPTVRTRGVGSFATITCQVTTDAGEAIGAIEARVKFLPSLDGPLEVLGFPIPIAHAAPNEAQPIEDLYGQGAIIACAVADGAGRAADATYHVTVTAP